MLYNKDERTNQNQAIQSTWSCFSPFLNKFASYPSKIDALLQFGSKVSSSRGKASVRHTYKYNDKVPTTINETMASLIMVQYQSRVYEVTLHNIRSGGAQ
jgi:hypothetical protein